MSLKSKVESLLFVSAKPMSTKQLSDLLKQPARDIEKVGDELIADYQKDKRGIQIIKNNTKFQMASSPENANLVQLFMKDEVSGDLSRPSLETLTIIAYRGPISKLDLDRIRGVNCSLIVRNLLMRGLVDAREDKDTKENYYTVTFDFLRFLGVNNVNELPDYEKLHRDDTIDQVLGENELDDKTQKEDAESKSELDNKEKDLGVQDDSGDSDKDDTEDNAQDNAGDINEVSINRE